jgi:PIN domain nuclease of toxin-antitoxin system
VNKVVLDASAILAILNQEPGAEKLTLAVLSGAVSSTVNLAEVQTRLVSKGGVPDEAWEDALSTVREAIPFSEEQAKIAGGLVSQTRALGLSLGDRACLALGIQLGAPVYTTDQAWKKLKLGISIHLLR